MKIFSPTLKGTTTVSGGITNLSGSFIGTFSGSVAGIGGDVSAYSASVTLRTVNLEAASGSFSTRTTNIERVYATTGSNTFTGAQTVQGTLTAQTLVVQTVTSSVLFSTGSNKIGSSLANVQEITGSVGITGSLAVSSAATFTGNITVDKSSPNISINTPSGTSGQYNINNGAGSLMWAMYSTTGGSNTQGNWQLYSAGKTGGAGNVIDITPAGAATFSSSITAGGAIYAGATSRIGFGTSGAERGAIILDSSFNWTINTNGVAGAMYIASATGNIGIGNTGNSSRRLEISQPSGYSAGIRIIADSGGDAKIQFLASGGSSQPDIGPAASAPNDLIFGAGGSERMRITSGGNIVVNTSGTSAPNAGQFVNKQRSDSTTPYLNGIVNMASGSSTTLSFWYDGSVHIIGASYYTGGDGGAYKPLTFQTGDVERMRITNTGRFGFNTTSPSRHYVFSNPDSRGAGGFEINATDSLVTFLSYNRSTSTYLPLSLSEGSSNVLVNSTNDVGAKLYVNGSTRIDGALSIIQQTNSNATYIEGNYNSQGSATNYKIVRHYPVVSSGSKLIIPFTSQGNLNGTTIVKIMGHSALWNTRSPKAFTAEFAVGHLTVLSDLTVLSSTGNISSISISGMNIEIAFTSAYTSATANGLYATIEYMTYVPSYSIIIGSIAMN